ncbi:hypothetical protein EDD85DRAFT_840857, partial [Armillaria nabsnona]
METTLLFNPLLILSFLHWHSMPSSHPIALCDIENYMRTLIPTFLFHATVEYAVHSRDFFAPTALPDVMKDQVL